MGQISVAVPKDHPLMVAWEIYKSSPEYGNTFQWADLTEHREGSLWAAFEAGWRAANSTKEGR